MNTVSDFVFSELNIRTHQWCEWKSILSRIRDEPIFENAYCGAYSCTVPRLNTTFVSRRHLWYGEPVSASSIARRILNNGLKMTGKKWIPWNKSILPLLAIPQPMYCHPVEQWQPLYYFDIKSCYYSIFSRMSLDFWFGGNYAHWGNVKFSNFLPDDLSDYKLCRNSIIGVMRSATSDRVKAGKIQTFSARNNLLSPCHWGFLSHLLHAIAIQAVGYGAVYYNTDGAIFPSLESGLKWVSFCQDLNLQCNLKSHGLGRITGIGRYQIAAHKVGAIQSKPEAYANFIQPSDKILQGWLQVC